MNVTAVQRSLRFNPGLMNAHTWYDHHGQEAVRPRKNAISSFTLNAETTPLNVMLISPCCCPAAVRNGCCRIRNT